MWPRCALGTVLVVALTHPTPVQAQAMEAVSAGSQALQWLGITPDQVAILTNLLESSRQVANHTNEILNYARASRQAAEILKHLSFEELQQESQMRLIEAFPELRQIDAELDTIRFQSDALWTDADARKGGGRDQIKRLAKFAGETSLWPRFFAEARRGAEYELSPTDLFVQRRYQETDTHKQRAYRGAVVQSLLSQTQALYRDSLLKDDMLVRSGAIAAQASVQTMSDTAEMLAQQQQDIAIEAQKKAESEAHRRALLKLVARHANFLTRTSEGP